MTHILGWFWCIQYIKTQNRPLLSSTHQSRQNTCYVYIWVFPKIMVCPNHPFFHRVFHYFHHPFWDTTILGNTQIYPGLFEVSWGWFLKCHAMCTYIELLQVITSWHMKLHQLHNTWNPHETPRCLRDQTANSKVRAGEVGPWLFGDKWLKNLFFSQKKTSTCFQQIIKDSGRDIFLKSALEVVFNGSSKGSFF